MLSQNAGEVTGQAMGIITVERTKEQRFVSRPGRGQPRASPVDKADLRTVSQARKASRQWDSPRTRHRLALEPGPPGCLRLLGGLPAALVSLTPAPVNDLTIYF